MFISAQADDGVWNVLKKPINKPKIIKKICAPLLQYILHLAGTADLHPSVTTVYWTSFPTTEAEFMNVPFFEGFLA